MEYWPILEKGIMQIDLQLRNIIEQYESNQRISVTNKINFEEVIDRCKQALASFQDFSNIHINATINSEVPFYNDPFRIQLIISNLLNYVGEQVNPDKGEIHLDVEIMDSPNGIQMMFTDDGVGIENEDMTGLFELIMSKGSSQDISLYLVKQAVENMKGTIDVTSIPGEGTSFNIFIPNLSQD